MDLPEFPELHEVPPYLKKLAEVARSDHLDVQNAAELHARVYDCSELLLEWAHRDEFWQQMCRDGFPMWLGTVLPHVTNGDHGLAALVQSRADVPPDPALKARKALQQVSKQLAGKFGLSLGDDAFDMGTAGTLVQLLGDIFGVASGGLIMAANLIAQGYPLSQHAGFLEAGANTILFSVKNLRQHLAQLD